MADVTLGTGATALFEYMLNGRSEGGAGAATNGQEGLTAFLKGMSGDFKIVCSPATATPLVSECTAAAQVYTIDVSLQTNDGEIHSWYNGPVKIAIAENDDGEGCTAAILPAAGEHMMTNGHLSVTVTMAKATWTATKKATLTVSDPDTSSFGGWAATDATFIATVTADPE